jgi:hypothetical protein
MKTLKIMLIMIAVIAFMIVAHGWNEDQQDLPIGIPYVQIGYDGQHTLEVACWYSLEDWEIVKGSAASFSIDQKGKVTVNAIDPAIGWGE